MAHELNYALPFKNLLTKEDIKDSAGIVITLQHLLYQCAASGLPGDEGVTIADKMQLHSIARKIAETQKLKPTDLVKLRERGSKLLSIMAFGFVATEIARVLGEEAKDVE